MWVITPLWLSGSRRSFLYSSSVYSCHLFLMLQTPLIGRIRWELENVLDCVRKRPDSTCLTFLFYRHHFIILLKHLECRLIRLLIFIEIIFDFFFFSPLVMSDSLQPHRLQHTRLHSPSPSPGVFSNSCPLNNDAMMVWLTSWKQQPLCFSLDSNLMSGLGVFWGSACSYMGILKTCK